MIMSPFSAIASSLCFIMDKLEEFSESSRNIAIVGTFLSLSFLFGLVIAELNMRGFFPDYAKRLIPHNHLAVISQVFNLLLFFEVLSLIFSFVHSVSVSMGKQIEVLSLVLLRDVFKEFSHFTEPIEWLAVKPFLVSMTVSAVGALCLFFILSIFYRFYESRPITKDESDTRTFIKIKKIIAFFLLVSFFFIILYEGLLYIKTAQPNKAFETFYTVLIFSDILIILVSTIYSSSYIVTFRNSGFAVATVFIRLALISPPLFRSLIGIGSALFVLGISFIYKSYRPAEDCIKTCQDLTDM